MTATLSLTVTIFALIGLGWVAVRREALGPGAAAALGAYVANIALPALIFGALTARPLAEIVDAVYLAAYAAGSLATLAIGYGWSRRSGFQPTQSVFRGMGMSCANSGFIGYPILAVAAPALAAPALALNMVVENLLVLPLILALAEAARGGVGAGALLRIAGRLARTPLILAMAAGAIVSGFGLPVPGALARGIGLVAQSSAAVSLVAIGAMLAGLRAGGDGAGGGVAAVVAGKLLLHPLLVAGAFLGAAWLGLAVDPSLAKAAVVMAATPAMGIYPILAGRYGEGGPAAVAMLGMVLGAFVTVNLLLPALGL